MTVSTQANLPLGWDRITLGELLPLAYGKSLVESARDPGGSVPVYGSSGIVGHHALALVHSPTLIVGRKGNVGAIYYSAEPCWVIDTAYFVQSPALLNLLFFRYLLDSLHLSKLDRSTAVPGLSRLDYERIEVAIPPELEQQRIVAEIEKQFTRLDAAIAALKRVQANLKRYRAAVLKAACEGRLVPTEAELARREGRSRAPANEYELGDRKLPHGWQVSTIQQSVKIIDYRGRTPPFSGSGIAHLRSSNIRGGRILWRGLAYVLEETYKQYMTRGLPEPGDILFTTEAPLGEVAMAPTDHPFSVAQRIMILRPKCRELDSRFLMYQIMSSRFRAILFGRGTGTTVTGVSSRNFRPAAIVIPPLSEQHRIIAEVEKRLSITDQIESQLDEDIIRAERLRQAILKKAFEGKLVPQDPNDEPASALLERIRGTATLGSRGTATLGCAPSPRSASNKSKRKRTQAGVPVPQKP